MWARFRPKKWQFIFGSVFYMINIHFIGFQYARDDLRNLVCPRHPQNEYKSFLRRFGLKQKTNMWETHVWIDARRKLPRFLYSKAFELQWRADLRKQMFIQSWHVPTKRLSIPNISPTVLGGSTCFPMLIFPIRGFLVSICSNQKFVGWCVAHNVLFSFATFILSDQKICRS